MPCVKGYATRGSMSMQHYLSEGKLGWGHATKSLRGQSSAQWSGEQVSRACKYFNFDK